MWLDWLSNARAVEIPLTFAHPVPLHPYTSAACPASRRRRRQPRGFAPAGAASLWGGSPAPPPPLCQHPSPRRLRHGNNGECWGGEEGQHESSWGKRLRAPLRSAVMPPANSSSTTAEQIAIGSTCSHTWHLRPAGQPGAILHCRQQPAQLRAFLPGGHPHLACRAARCGAFPGAPGCAVSAAAAVALLGHSGAANPAEDDCLCACSPFLTEEGREPLSTLDCRWAQGQASELSYLTSPCMCAAQW